MAWYSGSTEDAIAASKASSKLFVVYIAGTDADSENMNAVWEKPAILKFCISNCICLKLGKDSVACQQFAQISEDPVLIVPCTYMIGTNGTPLDIVGGFVNESNLIEKLSQAINNSSAALANTSPPSGAARHSTASVVSHDRPVEVQSPSDPLFSMDTNRSDTATPTIPAEDIPQSSAVTSYSDEEVSEHEPAPVVVQRSSLTPSEKVQKWQEKLKEYRGVKETEREKENKVKEIARRTTGKQMQEMKAHNEKIKRNHELEERKKDKMEQAEALKNVREQIARDRAEKQKRFQSQVQTRKEAEEMQAAVKQARNDEELKRANEERNKFARIQFRFPNGTSLTKRYEATQLFSVCLGDLKQDNSYALPRDFELFTTIPNRVFGPADKEMTIAELDLIPSAIIYIRPKKTMVEPSYSLFHKILQFLTTLLFLPFTLASKIFSLLGFGSAAGPSESDSQPDSFIDTSSSESASRDLRRRKKQPMQGRGTKSDGNVTRLRNRDDDDELATWNGNSTQQM